MKTTVLLAILVLLYSCNEIDDSGCNDYSRSTILHVEPSYSKNYVDIYLIDACGNEVEHSGYRNEKIFAKNDTFYVAEYLNGRIPFGPVNQP